MAADQRGGKVGAALKDLVTYDRSLTLENSRELRQVILGC